MENDTQQYIPVYRCKNCGAVVVDYSNPIPHKYIDFKEVHECGCILPDDKYQEFGILEQIGYKTKQEDS